MKLPLLSFSLCIAQVPLSLISVLVTSIVDRYQFSQHCICECVHEEALVSRFLRESEVGPEFV